MRQQGDLSPIRRVSVGLCELRSSEDTAAWSDAAEGRHLACIPGLLQSAGPSAFRTDNIKG